MFHTGGLFVYTVAQALLGGTAILHMIGGDNHLLSPGEIGEPVLKGLQSNPSGSQK